MNWNDLQVFLAIARTGRLSAAARRLDVEHTTVSRRLAALEAELGVPLFHHTAAGYVLTPHGRDVLASAEAMEGAAVAVASRAREKSAAMSGCVRVALPPEFASHWLAPRLATFRAAHPRIELQVLVGTRQRNLWRGEAELAVQSPRPAQRGLIAVRLARVGLALYAAKALVGNGRPAMTGPESIRGLPLLTYTSSFDMLQDASWFQALRSASDVCLTTNSTHALLAAAGAGAGVAVLPRFVARQDEDFVTLSDNVAERRCG